MTGKTKQMGGGGGRENFWKVLNLLRSALGGGEEKQAKTYLHGLDPRC